MLGYKMGTLCKRRKNLRHVLDKGACRDRRKKDSVVKVMENILRSIVHRYWQGKTSGFRTGARSE